MAPTRKKSVNKRFLNEVSPEKEVKSSSKNKQQVTGKKKLAGKLGPKWSKSELQQFYKAYRDHGKNWKKVAAEVRNRSVEMVEALYNMNRAYLSLPEGTASVIGLIAMMTDYYNVLEASDSDRESNDVPGMLRELQKRKRPKVQLSTSKELQQAHTVASTDGYLSLLKKGSGRPVHAVGKRTPRFPVPHLLRKDENYVSPMKKRRKSEINAAADEDEHDVVWTLAEALQREDSPQVSRTPCKRTGHMKSSPGRSWDRMSESSPANLRDASAHENWSESGVGHGDLDIGHAKDASSLAEVEGIGTVEVHRKGKKFYGKKAKVEKIGNNQPDDGGEACSGTEEEKKGSALKGKVEIEVSNSKIHETSRRAHRKSGKKLFSEDEHSDLIGLQTLAFVSAMEFESSAQLDEERTTETGDNNCSIPESPSTSHHRNKTKLFRQKEEATRGIEGTSTSSRKSKLGRYPLISAKSVPVANKGPQISNDTTLKRKRDALVSKVLDEEENTSAVRGKTPSKQLKSIELPEISSLGSDQKSAANDLAVSSAQDPVSSQVILPTRKRSRRKMDLKSAMVSRDGKFSENIVKSQTSNYSMPLPDGALHLKDKLSCCLSAQMVRKWCTFEWFYSAIDYPWFSKREFVEYLNHVGLGHIPRLTRVEWGVIRSSLGKPRRFSERFLHEEREKLKQYRESVRKHYTELRAGLREGLPTDLARPLSVGQRVIAIHPTTRELHNGNVLTVDHDRCRVQFDHAELGVEVVKDIDCMPSSPLDNMPEALRRQRFSILPTELQVNGNSNIGQISSEHLRNAPSPMTTMVKQAQVEANRAIPLAKATSADIVHAQAASSQPSVATHIQPKESEIRALSELNRALDKKEAWLMELKNTNIDILENQKNGDNSLKDSEPFKKHLATVLVQLKEASGQVSSALLNLRQHNTYPGNNNLPAWLKPPANSCFSGTTGQHDSSTISQESGSAVLEIVRGSRSKAHTMVDAAVKAIASMKEGEDAFVRIGEALDSVDKRHLGSESRLQVNRSSEVTSGSICHQTRLIPDTSEPQANSNAPEPQSHNSDKIETSIPSELISSCVAALLMIQTCTERQYPPSDVARIIDSAVTSLHPCCPQNLPIYREIQMCMGRIKTQILALIPT